MPAKPDQFSDFPPGPRSGRESLGWRIWQSDQGGGSRSSGPQGKSGQCCVYNQTSERFLSADVEAADFTVSGLKTRLQNLSPAAGIALWLVPFRGISPTSVRMPLDLLYLDRECVVIEAVESFPIFRVSASSRPAATVLVLPAKSIASTGTRAGDQLIFRQPAEMKHVLEELARIKPEGQQDRPGAQVSGAGQGLHQVLPRKAQSRHEPLPPGPDLPHTPEKALAPLDFAPQPPVQPTPALQAQPVPQNQESWPKKKKSWLERFLSTEPDDKRGVLRESIPGLTAFFFTGGAPVPHGIWDISETGVYVITDERWYPGTVVRMTLTDQREPTAERSFTVNAMVMRWGNDGVGLHFIFHDKKDRRRGNLSLEERAMGVADSDSFREFLGTLRSQQR
jgi:hypothetical protein